MVQAKPNDPSLAIGVFDSGIGGLSVLREMRRELPNEKILYLADNLHIPYGSRSLAEVRGFAEAITRFFLDQGVKMVVAACNTASAAALKHLRGLYPDIPFVGMEPAVKPAAAASRSAKVGVLATKATFQGELFESVVERFAKDVEVVEMPCPGLAELIEKAPGDGEGLDALLARYVKPLVADGVDSLVLACTHYPLVKERIQAVAGPEIAIFDPSNAIARRARQVLSETGSPAGAGGGGVRFYVTGGIDEFCASATRFMGENIAAQKVAL